MLNNMIAPVSFISLMLYGVDVFFCIRAIKQKDSKIYAATKSLLMPLLMLSFFMFLPNPLRGKTQNILVGIALTCHTLGDILLLFPKSKTKIFFYTGMLNFFAGHILYIASFILNDFSFSKPFAIGTLILVLGFEYIFYRQLILGARRYAPLFLPYSFGLAILLIVVGALLKANPVFIISFIGTCSFGFSDYCIARREIRMPIAGQMVVMPTYIAGQTLIVLGILLSQF